MWNDEVLEWNASDRNDDDSMTIDAIGQNQAPQTGGQTPSQRSTGRVGGGAGRTAGFAPLAAQNFASSQKPATGPSRGGRHALNASGRGQIVNIIV